MLSKKKKDAVIIISIGIAFGFIYPIFTDGFAIGPLINGLFIGIFGSSFIVLNEVVINKKEIRNFKFRNLVFYKTLLYTLFFGIIVPVVISITRSVQQNLSLKEFVEQGGLHQFIFEEDYFQIILYALFATLIFTFTYQMSRKMGQGVLWGFITGKYHNPKEEEYIFMYIDLTDSTRIAEQLGDYSYNKFLNNFFFDITESITNNNGKIYRYVGDEITVVWKADHKFKLEYAFQTYYSASEAIEKEKANYKRKFNIIPKFTAGLHCGQVVVGEIGEIKSQICFLGNAMHETGIIEKACKKFEQSLLLSEKLKKAYSVNTKYILTKQGEVDLNGIGNHMLYAVNVNEKG